MREELAKRADLRGVFTATFSQHGQRTSGGYVVPMILFVDVRDERGDMVTDHLWFNLTPTWKWFELQRGEQVKFNARVTSYLKGYIDKVRDWKLSYPTNISVLGRGKARDERQPELFENENGPGESSPRPLRIQSRG